MDKRRILILGLTAYAIMLVLAVIFYKERTVILDASYHLFNILKDDNPAIQVGRFGAVFTQFFPLIASKLGFSLQAVAMSYSISFIIFYLTCFVIILQVYKNKALALTLLLFNTVMVSYSFYWIQCEAVQGVAFTLLFCAYAQNALNKSKTPLHFYITTPFCLITIVYFYPLLPIPFLFILLFYMIEHKDKWKKITTVFAVFTALYMLKSLFFNSGYDSSATSRLNYFIYLFPDYFNLQSNVNFIKYLITDYYLFLILVCFVCFHYFKQKEFYKLILSAMFSLGYILLINVSYYEGADQFYLESQYLILTIFIALPFSKDIIPRFNKMTSLGILSGLIIVSLVRIYVTHTPFTERLDWYRETLRATEDKIIIDEKNVPLKTIWMSWGSSYEFWLLSTLETESSRSILIIENSEIDDLGEIENNKFLTRWGAFEYQSLNAKYFKFENKNKYSKGQKF